MGSAHSNESEDERRRRSALFRDAVGDKEKFRKLLSEAKAGELEISVSDLVDDNGGVSVLLTAVSVDDKEVLGCLLEFLVSNNCSEWILGCAAFAAVVDGKDAALEALIDKGKVCAEFVKENGVTLLMQAISSKNDVALMLLLAVVKDINVQSDKGWAALLYAVDIAAEGVVDMLLEVKDIDINLATKMGSTAVLLAAQKERNSILIKLLARKEVRVNRQFSGWTALMYSVNRKNHVAVKELCKVPSIDVNLSSDKGSTAVILSVQKENNTSLAELLKFPNLDVNHQYQGWTSLMYAVNRCNLVSLKMLLAFPTIDVNIQTDVGSTALMLACDASFHEATKTLLKREDLDVNMKNKELHSALYYAARSAKDKPESLDMVKALICKGATVEMDLLSKPEIKGYPQVVKVLEKWWCWLPEWNKQNHKLFPEQFRTEVFTWLLVSKRLKVFPKDMVFFVILVLSKQWKL